LPVAPEIHFTNANMDRAIVRQSELEGGVVTVRIPNSLLQTALTIKVYVGLYEGDTFKVIETIEIPVIAKARPSDYTLEDTDEEIYSFNKLENEIINAKNEMSITLNDKTNSLESRLSNIIAHNNDTEGNTELIDIRTNINGRVFDSAGDAVRKIEDMVCERFFPEWELGAIGGTNTEYDASNRILSIGYLDLKTFYSIKSENRYYYKEKEYKKGVGVWLYDASYTYLGYITFTFDEITINDILLSYANAKYARFVIDFDKDLATMDTHINNIYVILSKSEIRDKALSEQLNEALSERLKDIDTRYYWKKQRQRFNDKPIMVAYSNGAGAGLMNTELSYMLAALGGFKWLKGDVRPTSDGKLIMCHDAGFTFHTNGYITAYNQNSTNTRFIHDMTYAECMSFEYDHLYHNGENYNYRPKVCDLDQFLALCKEFEVRPYIVIRDEYMDIVVPELLRLLEYYDFTDNCIVNSFDLDSVRMVAEQSNHQVMISRVKSYSSGETLTIAEINNLLAISPNCTINIYTDETSNAWNNAKLAEASRDAITYAKSLGMVVGTAFEKEPHKVFKQGIGLIQCSVLSIPSKITVIPLRVSILNGIASMEYSGGYNGRYVADITTSGNKIQLSNIRLRGSTRDFPDGLPPRMAVHLPCTLTVTGDNVSSSRFFYDTNVEITFDTDVSDIGDTSKKTIEVKITMGI
jgi:glycerophosphoryl diester phosphodiesterase